MDETTREPDVFDQILAARRSVADRAEYVRIDTDRIAAYAAGLPTDESDVAPLDAERHFVGDEAETAAYFVTLGAINFGSGYFPYLTKRAGMSGYYTIASALTDRFRRGGAMPAAQLRAITSRRCARMFGQNMGSFPIRELMALFACAWNDLGNLITNRYNGRYERLIEASDRSAARLIEILSVQRFFRDVPRYRGLDVPLYKRAQLMASDLALAFGGEGLGRFDDLDRLTIFADNLVPHVLRIDGLLTYAEPLAAAIDRQELIRAGSEEELEIRGCAVHCVELIREALDRTGRSVPLYRLDQILWHRGQQSDYKSAKRHRTRTVFY